MKKLFQKAQSSFQKPPSQSSQEPTTDRPSTIGPPTLLDILRYRYHHGTNLGSIYVLEKWLSPSMFPRSSKGDSELDAVIASLKEIGLVEARKKLEQHWNNALSDSDLKWLVTEAKCTSIRLPIGFFTLGPQFCQGTAFESVSGAYINSWGSVEELVRRCAEFGIGVLLDFHALPGGANGNAHSGTNSGKAEFWKNGQNEELMTKSLVWAAGQVKHMGGVIGIQIVNEAVWEAQGMYDWYSEVIAEIGRVDDTIPIYISDAWNLGKALSWTLHRRVFEGLRNPVVVDTHKYYTFNAKDRASTPQQIINRVPGELAELEGKEGSVVDRGEAQVVVGEYSCVLDGKTWDRVPSSEKDGLVQQFGEVQSQKWQKRAGGAYFWTMKMDWMDGGEWGFVEQAKKGIIKPPSCLTLEPEDIRERVQAAAGKRVGLKDISRQEHETYWSSTAPRTQFRHALYGEGWDVGFSDAQKFFVGRVEGVLGPQVVDGADKIGCLEIWTKKRVLESGRRGEFVWE